MSDVIVIGGGVAGASAAIALASKGRSVTLIEQTPARHKPRRPDRVTRDAVACLDELGVDVRSCLGEPLAGAVFHPADLARTAEATEAEPPAFRVDYTVLTRLLRDRVKELGGQVVAGHPVTRIDAGEEHITACFESRDPITAAFAVIADGAAPPEAGAPGEAQHWVAEATVNVKTGDRPDHLRCVLGMDGGASLGTWWFDGKSVIIRLHLRGSRESLEKRWRMLLSAMRERGLLDLPADVEGADVDVRPAPVRSALETDTHVSKRALIVGDAGGFLSAVSKDGIHPAIWSARLAAEVLVPAADAPHPQDALRAFSTLWRTQMGETLRPPNTDPQFLLPLIFSNQQMADRMGAAFWHGENT